MSAPIISYQIAHAAAQDAGDRSMRNNGRTAWNFVDMAVAVLAFERLYGPPQYADSIIQPKGKAA